MRRATSCVCWAGRCQVYHKRRVEAVPGHASQAMQAQNMMWVPAIATSFAAVVNIPVNLLLIQYYGFPGAAAAFSVTRILLFLFLVGEHPRDLPSAV